jgi:BON domain
MARFRVWGVILVGAFSAGVFLMCRILYFATVAVGLGFSAEAFCQSMGGGASGGFGGSGGTGGVSTGSSGSSLLGSGGNSFSGTSFNGTTNSLSGGAGISGGTNTVAGRTGAGGRVTNGAVTISSTNFLSTSYGNPMYNGRPGTSNASPTAGGGFGQPSFGMTTTTTTTTRPRTTGTATITYGAVGSTIANQLSFATEVKFAAPPIKPTQMQLDLQGLVSRTSALKKPSDVRVEVVGNMVILRGRVADDDERRTVEGMMRLEPGVHEVRNELIAK